MTEEPPSRLQVWRKDAVNLLDIFTGKRTAFDDITVYPRLAFFVRGVEIAMLAVILWKVWSAAHSLDILLMLEISR